MTVKQKRRFKLLQLMGWTYLQDVSPLGMVVGLPPGRDVVYGMHMPAPDPQANNADAELLREWAISQDKDSALQSRACCLPPPRNAKERLALCRAVLQALEAAEEVRR